MEREIVKSEYIIGVEANGETYSGKNSVELRLIIDYVNKTYEIIPPKIFIATDCSYAFRIVESIKKAAEFAMEELQFNY